MTELFDGSTDVCFISADMANGENLADALLPALCSQANTDGGIVIIGAERAHDGSFIVKGLPSISETQSLIDELVSDKSKISVNTIKSVNEIRESGKDILKIEVESAPWTERPVYINSDPVHGVYRYFEGERIPFGKKFITMMAKDSVELQNDGKRLENLSESSIDLEAIKRYRKLHREKRPFPKWDLLDDENYLERIGAKSEGRLLRAGFLMFGENKNVSFSLHRLNGGDGEKIEAKSIWRFIELVMPLFDRYPDIKCKNAVSEAFLNSLIHADYNLGKIEITEGSDRITFINSGIPRSADNLSVCRNLRIMKMLCLVGYARNKCLGLKLIQNYSKSSILSVDYDRWQTEITIPVTAVMIPESAKTGPENIATPFGFYPVVELVKLDKQPEEQEAANSDAGSEEIKPEDEGYLIISIPDEIEEEKPIIDEAEETDNTKKTAEDTEIETEHINNVIFEVPDELSDERAEPISAEPEERILPDLKESEQGKVLEQLVKEYRLKSVFKENTAELISNGDGEEPEEPGIKENPDIKAEPDEPAETDEPTEPNDVQPLSDEVKKKSKPKSRVKISKPKPLHFVMGNLINEDEDEITPSHPLKGENELVENKNDGKTAEKTKKSLKNAKKNKVMLDGENAADDEHIERSRGENNNLTDELPGAVNSVRENSHASPAMIKDALFEYCNEFRSIGEISSALMRPESSLKRHISRMIKEGKLEVNDNNAYRSVSGTEKIEGDV